MRATSLRIALTLPTAFASASIPTLSPSDLLRGTNVSAARGSVIMRSTLSMIRLTVLAVLVITMSSSKGKGPAQSDKATIAKSQPSRKSTQDSISSSDSGGGDKKKQPQRKATDPKSKLGPKQECSRCHGPQEATIILSGGVQICSTCNNKDSSGSGTPGSVDESKRPQGNAEFEKFLADKKRAAEMSELSARMRVADSERIAAEKRSREELARAQAVRDRQRAEEQRQAELEAARYPYAPSPGSEVRTLYPNTESWPYVHPKDYKQGDHRPPPVSRDDRTSIVNSTLAHAWDNDTNKLGDPAHMKGLPTKYQTPESGEYEIDLWKAAGPTSKVTSVEKRPHQPFSSYDVRAAWENNSQMLTALLAPSMLSSPDPASDSAQSAQSEKSDKAASKGDKPPSKDDKPQPKETGGPTSSSSSAKKASGKKSIF